MSGYERSTAPPEMLGEPMECRHGCPDESVCPDCREEALERLLRDAHAEADELWDLLTEAIPAFAAARERLRRARLDLRAYEAGERSIGVFGAVAGVRKALGPQGVAADLDELPLLVSLAVQRELELAQAALALREALPVGKAKAIDLSDVAAGVRELVAERDRLRGALAEAHHHHGYCAEDAS